MIYTDPTKKSMNLMFELHKDQKEKFGVAYVFHPWHVAESIDDENSTIVALLHDSVEDTNITLEDLRSEGFPDEAIEAIALMTHADGVSYMDYVKGLAHNPIARKVKLSDLRHNSDITRLNEITEKDLRRIEKYKWAIEYLEGIE